MFLETFLNPQYLICLQYKEVAQDKVARFFDVRHSLETIADIAEDIASGVPIPKETWGHLIDEFKEKLC